MKNNKGFVLLETVIVLLVVVVAMLGLYSTYSFVIKNLNQASHYDDINDIYKVNIFYNQFISKNSFPNNSEGVVVIDSEHCSDYFDDNCATLYDNMNIDSVIYNSKTIFEVLSNPVSLLNTDINYMKDLEGDYKYVIIRSKEENGNINYASLKVGLVNGYKLTYNNNGGAGCSIKYTEANSVWGNLCKPSKENAGFAGWYTSANGGEQFNGSEIATSDTTIYAHWSNGANTLIYENNGGNGCVSKTGTYGQPWGELCTPTREGHLFDGWHTERGGGVEILPTSIVTGNQTVYANWIIGEYILSYNNTGGIGCTSKAGNYGLTWGTLCTPIRDNYNFVGWFTEEIGGNEIKSTTTVNRSVSVYAHWKPKTYTLTYKNGNGCGSKVQSYGSLWGELCVPTNEGTFLGWYTEANGGTEITSSTAVSENLTVYAHWQ